MTIESWLKQATEQLGSAGIGTARLDCLVLLEDVTGKSRAHLLAHPELKLSIEHVKQLRDLLTRRMTHKPLAYIRGKTEFYGREFTITHAVLEPRPESETMIDLLKKIVPDNRVTIVDVGTGSGALAITAKLEASQANVYAVDIDPGCLKIARENAYKLGAGITCLEGDLLEPLRAISLKDQRLALLANLPYVPTTYHINEAALQEPHRAIFGGKDGLDLYREMFDQLLEYNAGFVLTESLPFQHDELATIAQKAGYTQSNEEDFIQLFCRTKSNSSS